MIDWKPVTLNDRAFIEERLKRHPLEVSDLTFTNIWMWGHLRDPHFACANEFLCIKLYDQGTESLLMPVGEGDRGDLLRRMAEDFASRQQPLRIRAIVNGFLTSWQEAFPGPYFCSPDTNHFDYIYSAEDLRGLHGNKFQAKRNHVHQFIERYAWEYRALTPDLLPAVIAMQNIWSEEHSDKQKDLQDEHTSVLQLLRDYERLSVMGGVLLVDGQVVAYSVAEQLTANMVLIHVEKALRAFKGAYQMINQQLLLHTLSSNEFVNREEDLGIPSLTKAKQSYHPVRYVQKWTIEVPKGLDNS